MQLEVIQIKNRLIKYRARHTLFRLVYERVIEEVHFRAIQNYKKYGYAMVLKQILQLNKQSFKIKESSKFINKYLFDQDKTPKPKILVRPFGYVHIWLFKNK